MSYGRQQYDRGYRKNNGSREELAVSKSRSFDPDDQELMKFYQLRTLSPTSWADSNVKEFKYNSEDTEDVEKAYEILKALSGNSTSERKQIVDEPDPLGYFNSISQALVKKGIIQNPDDPQKQNYFIGSKEFNPILFLTHLHDADSFSTLNKSLDYLEHSIADQSEKLRMMISKEFIRFVKSKSSLDSVYGQVDSSGLIGEDSATAGPLNQLASNVTLANAKASTIIKPIVDNKKKENNLKVALEIVEANEFLFDLPSSLTASIESQDYDTLTINYNKGRDIYFSSSEATSQKQLATKKLLDRVWEEVEAIVDGYKKDLWDKLADPGTSAYISIIGKLLQLGVEDNPIIVWINTQYQNIAQEISVNFSNLFENLQSSQLQINETISMTDISFIYHLTSDNRLNKLYHGLVDSSEIIEMWMVFKKLIDDVIVSGSASIKLYWNACELFLNNKIQATLPKGYNDESAVHLKLSDYEKKRIVQNAESLISLTCENFERFLNSTEESLPSLSIKTKLVNLETYEIKSPRNYGFIPPFANSLSTIRYLRRFIKAIYTSFNNIGNLNISDTSIEILRSALGRILKKFVSAVCATWTNDVSLFNTLEDYRITNIKKELSHSNDLIISNTDEAKRTKSIDFEEIDCQNSLIQLILIYQKHCIKNVYALINSTDNHHSEKFYASIQNQFLKNFEILLISMMKKVTTENKGQVIDSSKTSTLDLYELWTLDNFIEVEDTTLSLIVEYFDETFKTKLASTKLEVSSLLPKLQKATFNSYCESKQAVLTDFITQGIQETDWNTAVFPKEASAYIYKSLTYLIILHSTISKVSKKLIYTVIHELQNHITAVIEEQIRKVQNFSVEGLQQITLDVEFFRSIFKNATFQLGKTALNNLTAVLKKVVRPRTDLDQILSSIGPVVDSEILHSKTSFACFKK